MPLSWCDAVFMRKDPPFDLSYYFTTQLLSLVHRKSEAMRQQQFGFQFSEDSQMKATTSDVGLVGYRLLSEDGRHIVQIRKDGFTFSRLQPYETWEGLRAEAKKAWQVYVNTVLPETVSRIAVRYINVLELPLPIGDLSDYVTAPPQLPPGLSQKVTSFFTRIVFSDPSINAAGILTQVVEGVIADKAPFVLDIDVFRETECAADGDDCWNTLEKLRELKNQVFFEAITDRTAESFE